MAFNLQKLAKMTRNTNTVFQLWMYETADDAQAVIAASGYMNDASDRLSVGDLIFAKDSAGAVIQFIVTGNTDGVVDLSNGVAIAATDAD